MGSSDAARRWRDTGGLVGRWFPSATEETGLGDKSVDDAVGTDESERVVSPTTILEVGKRFGDHESLGSSFRWVWWNVAR